jgi:prephenate dehydrogenase
VSTPAIRFNRISIVGLGLIGGSWAMALERAGIRAKRVGCDRPVVLKRALASGAISEGFTDLKSAVRDADLVILAAPVGTILEQLSLLKPLVSPKTLITDTGSTKRLICARAQSVFGEEPLFLGGHPLAGKERSGFENADAALFEEARYVLTPFAPIYLADVRVRTFATLLKAIGARPYVAEPEVHDRAAAFLSHLPQLVSSGLAAVAARRVEKESFPLEMAAAGFRDLTRLAESPHELWKDICLTNQDNIKAALDALIEVLETMKAHLGDPKLELEFKQAQRLRAHLKQIP